MLGLGYLIFLLFIDGLQLGFKRFRLFYNEQFLIFYRVNIYLD